MFDGLPDLLLSINRKGVLLGQSGGDAVASLRPPDGSIGRELATFWSAPVATSIKQWVRQSLSSRGTIDGHFAEAGDQYEARVSAQGPDRALCVIRRPSKPHEENLGASGLFRPVVAPEERRSFARRFADAIASASLRERPLAACIIELDGLTDLSQALDTQFAAKALQTLVRRLSQNELSPTKEGVRWFAGPLSETVLGLVIESRDRNRIEELVVRHCEALREPLLIGRSSFVLTPYAGVAILGADASAAEVLLKHARAAAAEARRRSRRDPSFFSDTVKLRSLARIDLGGELRDALDKRELTLRYIARHELASATLTAAVGVVHWPHPLRGEVRPAEFLPLAESTGMASTLSRSVMHCLHDDYPRVCAAHGTAVRLSFAPLRHHVLDEDFVAEIATLVGAGGMPAQHLELRIDERTLLACDFAILEALAALRVPLVMDDFGRDAVSLKLMGRIPLAGLQLDRSWMQGVPHEPQALKLCRGAIGLAQSLGITPIATGIDSTAQRDALIAMGCTHGSGKLYGELSLSGGSPRSR